MQPSQLIRTPSSDHPKNVFVGLPSEWIRIGDIRTGDILFSRRPGSYQTLNQVAGDTWRHIAIAVEMRSTPWTIEISPDGFAGRPLSTFLARYETVAVRRFTSCPTRCNERVVDAALARMESPVSFPPRRRLAAVGMLSLSQLITDRPSSTSIRPLVDLLARRWSRNAPSEAMCSSLLVWSTAELCDQHQLWPNAISGKRRHSKPTPEAPISTIDRDRRIAERFAVPDEIWRSLGNNPSYWVKRVRSEDVVFATQLSGMNGAA